MSDEFGYSPGEKLLSSIAALTEKQSVLEERRICELSELASSLAVFASEMIRDDGMSPIEALSLLSDLPLSSELAIHSDSLPQNRYALKEYISALRYMDKTLLSRLLIEKMKALDNPIAEADFLPSMNLPERFIYVKNAFADEAYDVFSDAFADPRVRYAQSFKEALAQLSDGTVTYCLLPLEERGVRIPSVAQLIFSADLKINSVTPVFGFDGSADMKYALLSRQYSVPAVSKDDDRYLEIRISADFGDGLPELLLAAKGLGASVYRINSIFFDTEEERAQYYSLIFKEEGGDFSPLLTYLTLFVPSHTVVGLYTNLEL